MDLAYLWRGVDIGTVIAYNRGERPRGPSERGGKTDGIEAESIQETQTGQENAADEAPSPSSTWGPHHSYRISPDKSQFEDGF